MNKWFTWGELQILKEKINSVLALSLIASFSLGMLMIFFRMVEQDPVGDLVSHNEELQRLLD